MILAITYEENFTVLLEIKIQNFLYANPREEHSLAAKKKRRINNNHSYVFQETITLVNFPPINLLLSRFIAGLMAPTFFQYVLDIDLGVIVFTRGRFCLIPEDNSSHLPRLIHFLH